MNRQHVFLACAILVVSTGVRADEKTIAGLVNTDKMAEALGDGWKRDRSMVIESEKGIAKLTGTEKQMGEMILKLMRPHGVIACGEFSFSRTKFPLNNVTVKVFKFSSAAKADAFRKLKYENEKAKPLYKKKETKSAVIYDSLQMKKRIVFQGVFWITCGHIQNDDQHLKILNTCIRLESLKRESDNKPYLKATPAALEAWKDWRFGMFLCWGPVTLTGQEIGWSRGMGAQGMRPGLRGNRGKTPAAVYDDLYKRWRPDQFDAEHWVKVAKDAGQKYLIYLVKHHDGFCLYDSKLTDYKSTGPDSAWKVDTLRAVADACRKHDLKLILYYSQPDWHHPDYLTKNHERYIEYLHGQVRELLTNYGKIDGLWFDNLRGRGDNPAAAKLWDAERLFKMARRLQPDLVINDRCGLDADFYTPEQHVGRFNRDRPWESCITLGTQWAWKPDDRLKSYEEAIRMLVVCATGDGNLALNTNPMPNGRIEPRQVESFMRIGKWMRAHGESIYGTRGGPFVAPDAKVSKFGDARDRFPLPDGQWWGGSTHRGKTVFLHILRWPSDTIRLGTVDRKLIGSSVLTGGTAQVNQTSDGITVSVPKDERHPVDTIVTLEFDRSVEGVAPVERGD